MAAISERRPRNAPTATSTSRSRVVGAGRGDGDSGTSTGASTSTNAPRAVTPETPSTRQWWTSMNSATRPPSPSTSVRCHSARRASKRPRRTTSHASSRSRSPVPANRTSTRTWYSKSKSGASTQYGRPSPRRGRTSIYLHGSAVLGGLQPASDVDVLVVSRRRLDDRQRQALLEGLHKISGPGDGARPVELTVVVQPEVRPWRFPPTGDFLYGEWLRDELQAGRATTSAAGRDLRMFRCRA